MVDRLVFGGERAGLDEAGRGPPRRLEHRVDEIEQAARMHEQRARDLLVAVRPHRQQGDLAVGDEQPGRQGGQHPDLFPEGHHRARLVEEAGALDHSRLDDDAIGDTAGEGPVFLDVLAAVDERDLAKHEHVDATHRRGLQLPEPLHHRVGAEHDVDHVGHFAAHGALAVELAELGQHLVRLGQPALALEQHRSQRERRR